MTSIDPDTEADPYLRGHATAVRWSGAGCRGDRPKNPYPDGSEDAASFEKGFDDGMDDWDAHQSGDW